MSSWDERTWGDISTLAYGKALKDYRDGVGDVRVYGTNGPVGWTQQHLSRGPGLVIGRKGAYRGIHYAPADFWVIDTAFFLVPKEDLNLKWAYYELKRRDINSMDSGSAIPSTSRPDFYALPVRVPPRDVQDSIARVLGGLDAKAAGNRKLAESAERLSAVIVEARAQGDCSLGEIADLQRRSVDPRTLGEQAVQLYSLPVFDETRLPERTTASAIASNKFALKGPSVLLSKLNPAIPRLWLYDGHDPAPAIASTEFLVLEPKLPVSAAELWAACQQRAFFAVLAAQTTGTSTSHQRVRPADVLGLQVPDPRGLLAEERHVVNLLLRRAGLAREQARLLEELRDVVAPQVLSGQWDVSATGLPEAAVA